MVFTRITSDPTTMAGVPCIRGLRFPVATVIAMVADGMTNEEILADEIAANGNTINYEIVCKISPRVTRIFVQS